MAAIEEAVSPPPSDSSSDSGAPPEEVESPLDSPPHSPNSPSMKQPPKQSSSSSTNQQQQQQQSRAHKTDSATFGVQVASFASPTKAHGGGGGSQLSFASSSASLGRASQRHRSSVIWNPPGGANGGAAPRKLQRERLVHLMEQSLQYRLVMKPKTTPSSQAEMMHAAAVVYSFLQANGCGRTAALMRDSMSLASSAAPVAASSFGATKAPLLQPDENLGVGERIDFVHLIQDACRRTCLMFDDDSLHRTDHLLAKSVDLQVLDPTAQTVGGPIELLLERLILTETDTPVMDGKPALNFTTVFMLTNSLFVCPEALFSRLAKLFKTVKSQQQILGDARALGLQKRILSVVLSFLGFSSVDVSRLLLERITTLCVSIVQAQGSPTELVKMATLLHGKVQELAAVASSSSFRPVPLATLPPDVGAALLDAPPSVMSPDKEVAGILDVDDVELCRQVCLLSFELASSIHPREMLHAAWSDPGLKVLASNLVAYTNYRQLLTRWIASMILAPPDLQTRTTVLRKAIRLSRALYNCQNFDMCAVVLEGIRHQAVARLKQTFSSLSSSDHEELEGLNRVVDPFNPTLRDAPYQITSPMLPLLPPFISVFFRAEECGSTTLTLSDGTQVVNWSKMLAIAKPLVRWVSFQATPYRYRILPHVQRLLWQCSGVRGEEQLAAMSRQREMPPPSAK